MGNQTGKYKVPKVDESSNSNAKAQVVEPIQPHTNDEGAAANVESVIVTSETTAVNEEKKEDVNEEEIKENGNATEVIEEKQTNGSVSKDIVQNGTSNGHAHKEETETEADNKETLNGHAQKEETETDNKTTHTKKKSKMSWLTKKISFKKTKSDKAAAKGAKKCEENGEFKEENEDKPEETAEIVEEKEVEQKNEIESNTETVPEVKSTEPTFESIPPQEVAEGNKEEIKTVSESQANNISEDTN